MSYKKNITTAPCVYEIKKELTMIPLIFIFAIASAIWGIVSSLGIASDLSKRGIKINYPLFRLLMLKYIHQYHEITKKEGKTGPWFYSYIISMNLALILVVIGFILI
ncbi:hypothetical protein ACFL4L_01090 [bacterium]